MKEPEEFLTRGKGNFINCTDYDEAIQAMKDYAAQFQTQNSKKNESVCGFCKAHKWENEKPDYCKCCGDRL